MAKKARGFQTVSAKSQALGKVNLLQNLIMVKLNLTDLNIIKKSLSRADVQVIPLLA